MMEEFIEEEKVHESESESSPEIIDWVYEFDASQFFDFTRPESASDDEKAEQWFQVAGYYPPSPFFLKLKLKDMIPIEEAKESPMSKGVESSGTTYDNRRVEDTPKAKSAKSKSTSKSSKPRSSTLMKPTASQLAKQNHAIQDHQATKRQKLETGYLRKGGLLSPVTKTLHYSKLNVTVPRGPDLETRRRAQWRRFRSKNDLDTSEHITKKPIALNKNILESPSRPKNKKSKRRSPMSQEPRISNDGKLLQYPPILELFSQLSLKSDMDNTGAVSHPKHNPFEKVNLKKYAETCCKTKPLWSGEDMKAK